MFAVYYFSAIGALRTEHRRTCSPIQVNSLEPVVYFRSSVFVQSRGKTNDLIVRAFLRVISATCVHHWEITWGLSRSEPSAGRFYIALISQQKKFFDNEIPFFESHFTLKVQIHCYCNKTKTKNANFVIVSEKNEIYSRNRIFVIRE